MIPLNIVRRNVNDIMNFISTCFHISINLKKLANNFKITCIVLLRKEVKKGRELKTSKYFS